MANREDFQTAIICVEGKLGAGKTLGLTYLTFRKYLKNMKIFTNYHLFFPKFKDNTQPEIIFLNKLDDLLAMKQDKGIQCWACLDELWSLIDSRNSNKKINKLVTNILLKSRKRGINIGYTAQSFDQADKRLRNITDFIARPQLTSNNQICRIDIFSYDAKMDKVTFIKTYKFNTAPFFQYYDTTEEINVFGDEEESKKKSDDSEPEEKRNLDTFDDDDVDDSVIADDTTEQSEEKEEEKNLEKELEEKEMEDDDLPVAPE